jgi:hypothetical protein
LQNPSFALSAALREIRIPHPASRIPHPASRIVPDSPHDKIKPLLLQFAQARGRDKTFCPSEVAREIAPETWRDWMPAVREEAARLVATSELRCTQRGRAVDDPQTAHGPIRLSLPRP